MSTGSKIALGSSILFTTGTIGFVVLFKKYEEDARRIGINRDAHLRSQQRIDNEVDQIQQDLIRKQMEQEQSVTRPSHLNANMNNRIIIVDNDAKAQALATLLDKDTVSKGVTDKSNLSFISGKFNSVPVSLIAVGLGSAAAEVAIHDICALISGMKLIIRIGTCAGIGNQSAIGNVNVPKDGSIMATKNIDYWAERYVQHAEEAADSSIGKMFDTGLQMFQSTFVPPYHVSNPTTPDAILSNNLFYYLQEEVGIDYTFSGLNCTTDSFYSVHDSPDHLFGEDNQVLIKYVLEKYPQMETVDLDAAMLFHCAQMYTFQSKLKKSDNLIRVAACEIVVESNEKVVIDAKALSELELKTGRGAFIAITKATF
ncbi:nucleoside phosphorylase domain-containing protein [Globomyces pollinis-pini]|nr:nucleoside phosphorylase domain-containing protein [Globomyces pollinis-pini]